MLKPRFVFPLKQNEKITREKSIKGQRQLFKSCIADAVWCTRAFGRGLPDCAALCPDRLLFLHYDPDRSGHLRSGHVSAFRLVGGKFIQPAALPKARRGRALGGVDATRIIPKNWNKRTLSDGRGHFVWLMFGWVMFQVDGK